MKTHTIDPFEVEINQETEDGPIDWRVIRTTKEGRKMIVQVGTSATMKDYEKDCGKVILRNITNIEEELAWLLEVKTKEDQFATYPRFDPATGQIKMTLDPADALRFVRPEDAEAIKTVFWNYGIINVTDPQDIGITEHRWISNTPLENENQKEVETTLKGDPK